MIETGFGVASELLILTYFRFIWKRVCSYFRAYFSQIFNFKCRGNRFFFHSDITQRRLETYSAQLFIVYGPSRSEIFVELRKNGLETGLDIL